MGKSSARSLFSFSWYKVYSILAPLVLLLAVFVVPAIPGSNSGVKTQPVLLEMAAHQPNTQVSVIVQVTHSASTLKQTVQRLGGVVNRDLSLINGFVAQLPAQAVPELAQQNGVRWLSLDAPVFKTGLPAACDLVSACIDTDHLNNAYIKAIGADKLWNVAPYLQGQNITVAVVDSGITPVNDFKGPGGNGNSRVVGSALINDFNQSKTQDDFGHGTHVAGIIAGNGTLSDGVKIGVAPQAKLINVQVSDGLGSSTMSDVIGGLEWIYNNRLLYNIKVVNISLNSSMPESYLTSPLDAAVEVLWLNKMVVVVSAGNSGLAGLYPPANDPFVITVGATNDKGTTSILDDEMASFSAYGTTPDGIAKPDLVAPGTNIISLLSRSNNTLALAHPLNIASGFTNASYYFRMSGTSMAAPMVAGSVALLLQSEPDLTPDQVKYRLKATARPFATPERAGAGYLDVYAAVRTDTSASANTGLTVNKLLWTGGKVATWNTTTWNSVNWSTVNWSTVNWSTVNWSTVSWNSTYWGP